MKFDLESRLIQFAVDIIKVAELIKSVTEVDRLIDENNQLISIFVASIKTSKAKNS